MNNLLVGRVGKNIDAKAQNKAGASNPTV